MTRKFVTMLLLSLGMVAVAAGEAQARMPGMGPGPIIAGLMDLELTEAQKSQIAQILKGSEGERDVIGTKRSEVRDILAPVLEDTEATEQQVRDAFRKAAPLMEDLMVMRLRMRSKIMKVLTPQQKEQLKADRERFKKRMERGKRLRRACLESWLEEQLR